jgi:virginiamycin A acetyltransferase
LKIAQTICNITSPYGSINKDQFLFIEMPNVGAYPIYAIGKDSYIVSALLQTNGYHNMHIGRYCSLSDSLIIQINQNHDYTRVSTGKPCFGLEPQTAQKCQLLIQNDVWIGQAARITGSVTIRNGAVIAANSHVVKDVPPYAIVGGNPAKIIKYRFSDEQIADLQNIAWWDWDDAQMEAAKDDFALPIEGFIEKYRKPPFLQPKAKNFADPKLLFFADFHEPLPFWQHIVKSYCDNPKGQLIVVIQNELYIEKRLRELREFAASVYSGKGKIIERVQNLKVEDELFAEADCYITSRSLNTVRRTCLADKYGLKIISCADIPFGHELMGK